MKKTHRTNVSGRPAATALRRRLLRLVAPATLLMAGGTLALRAQQPDALAGRLGENTQAQIESLLKEKAVRSKAQQRVSSQLLLVAKERREGGVANAAVPELKSTVAPEAGDGRMKVDLTADVSAELLEAIKAAGGTVLSAFPGDRAIRALLPVESVEALAERPEVQFIRPAVRALTNTGQVNSQGDVAHRANQARSNYSVSGAGIKVGVLSDSIDDSAGSFAKAKASNDVTSNLTVLSGQAGSGAAEGLAMLEIVHDLAPDAQLYFATAFASEASFANNIRALANAGCRVIIDDVGYFDESPFQDGIVSKAVNDVSAKGVLYFSSAANSGNKDDSTSGTWEGDFRDGGAAPAALGESGRVHAFATGVTKNTVLSGGSSRTVNLFWSDPLGKATNDYDVFVVNSAGNVVASSTDTQSGTQDPYENIATVSPNQAVVVVKYSGASRFLHLDIGRGYLTYATAGSTRGHNAAGAANAFCVAATSAANRSSAFTGGTANPVETFSSDGPRRIFYNADGSAITANNFTATGGRVLNKPDLTAADGVATTLPGNSGLNPFYGTSAAAPHAGAIAALLLSYRPSATAAQVRSALTSSCLDIEASGYDRDAGQGIVIALGALQNLSANGAKANAAATAGTTPDDAAEPGSSPGETVGSE